MPIQPFVVAASNLGMDKFPIYVDYIGGRWEARYYHTDEDRYFRFTSHDRTEAIRKAVADTGYSLRDVRIVDHSGNAESSIGPFERRVNLLTESVSHFTMGRIVATPAALRALGKSKETAAAYLQRHAKGDWGEVDSEDARSNEDALRDGERLLSVYVLKSGEKIWIITEADRSVTTILLPSDY